MKVSQAGLVVVLAAGIGAIVLGSALAQSKPAEPAAGGVPKVGLCDVVKLFADYQRSKDIETRMTQKRRDLKAQDDMRAKQIMTIEQELKEGLKPGSKEYDSRLEELTRLSIERETWQKTVETQEAQERRRIAEDVYKDILRALGQVAKEQGCQIVLSNDQAPSDNKSDIFREIDRRKVLYADAGVNLTDAVLARLNDTYRAVPR